ncbi:hypothetical protein Tco_1342370, partial [Tanacetum coccineum]
AFLATTDVLEIYMQQFWHTVTKIKESTFYEFKLANKKCQFDVEVFLRLSTLAQEFKEKNSLLGTTKGKGSKGKQQEVTTKKKTIITINDNIITDDPNVAFELGKLISKTDGEVADETRRVHETHACLVTEKVIAKAKHDVVIDWGSEEESNKSDENVDDIPWVSTSDEEEKGDDDDDDDMSIDIEENDDERTDSNNGDQAMTD